MVVEREEDPVFPLVRTPFTPPDIRLEMEILWLNSMPIRLSNFL
jgi:hypothetical protein